MLGPGEWPQYPEALGLLKHWTCSWAVPGPANNQLIVTRNWTAQGLTPAPGLWDWVYQSADCQIQPYTVWGLQMALKLSQTKSNKQLIVRFDSGQPMVLNPGLGTASLCLIWRTGLEAASEGHSWDQRNLCPILNFAPPAMRIWQLRYDTEDSSVHGF